MRLIVVVARHEHRLGRLATLALQAIIALPASVSLLRALHRDALGIVALVDGGAVGFLELGIVLQLGLDFFFLRFAREAWMVDETE